MKSYAHQFYLKKKLSNLSQKNSEKIYKINLKLINNIFNTLNISLLVLIFTLFFLSFDSQRKWTNKYKTLSKTKVINNNLNIYKKTKPNDLIYLDKIPEKKVSLFRKNLRVLIEGVINSEYQRGY